MSWNIENQGQWKGKYVYLKNNRREDGGLKTKRIYLGPVNVAVEILGELQTKPLINEKLKTYSGEAVLGKIADSIGLSNVLLSCTGNEKESAILRNIIILRALFNKSKLGLVERILPYSVFEDKTDIKYIDQVYRSMDAVYAHLDDFIYQLARNAIKKYKFDLTYLVIDGTGIRIYKDEETGLVKFGYKSEGLPQIKLVLGVNGQHIPIMGKCYSGSASDVEVFDDVILNLDSKYKFISKKAKKKYVVFDQGNVSKENIEHMNNYKDKKIFFVSIVRSGMREKFIDLVDKSKMELIYDKEISKNNHTKIYGKPLKGDVYQKKCSVLVCHNPDIEEQKNNSLNEKIKIVKDKIAEINKSNKNDASEAVAMISQYKLKRALKINGKKNFELIVNDKELEKRRKYFGFFVLFSNDLTLSSEMITIYKSRNIVEEGFRELKSDMEITPEYHRRDDRIETHTVLVVCGYLLLSVLRAIVSSRGNNYSFGELKEIITSGYLTEGYYEHKQFGKKKLFIRRPNGFKKELTNVFSSIKLRMPKIEYNLMPTNF
jgi:transposase